MNDKAKRLHYMYIQTPTIIKRSHPPPAQSYYRKSVVVVVCLPASPQGQAGSLGIGCQVTSLSALTTQGTTMDNTQCKGRNPEWKRSDLCGT